MSNFFTQQREIWRDLATRLITDFFGATPPFKVGLIVAKIIEQAEASASKLPPLEREVWLHATLFKLVHPLIDPQRELINGNLATLSPAKASLAELQTVAIKLQLNLTEARTSAELTTIQARSKRPG